MPALRRLCHFPGFHRLSVAFGLTYDPEIIGKVYRSAETPGAFPSASNASNSFPVQRSATSTSFAAMYSQNLVKIEISILTENVTRHAFLRRCRDLWAGKLGPYPQ